MIDTINGFSRQSRQLSADTYNAFDLPQSVHSGGTLMARYAYTADGTKVSALDASGAGLVYRGPFTYRRASGGTLTLEGAPFDGGRLTEAGARYHVTDHLGSVRAVWDGTVSATSYPMAGFYSMDDYASYGVKSASGAASAVTLKPTGSTVSLRDGFTGQEDQGPDFSVPYLDFGARQYSPSLSRWLVPDPMGEKYYDVSPYAYCAGNPVSLVDPDGMDWYAYNENGQIKYKYVEKQMSHEEVEEGNYTYLGYTYQDSDGNYYSLFGSIIPLFDSNGNKTLSGFLYQHIDDIIINAYGNDNGNGQAYINFYTGIKPGVRTISYDGHTFSSLREGSFFEPANNMRMSILHIDHMPQFKEETIQLSISDSKKRISGCHSLALANSSGYYGVQIVYDRKNGQRFMEAMTNLFNRGK